MSTSQICIGVTEASQVGEARRIAHRFGGDHGFSERSLGQVAIVVTELATNLVTHGRGGRVYLQLLDAPIGRCLEVLSVDAGPGMANVGQCLQDGFSTGGTPGTGLGAVRRMSVEFDVYSQPGRGCVIVSRVATGTERRSTVVPFRWGALASPARGELVCGDAWRIVETGDRLSVMVADGLGHGPQAAEASDLAVSTFAGNPLERPAEIMNRAHRALHGGRGAAVASARIEAPSGVAYCGVGNINGVLAGSARPRGLFTHNGTVGVQMRTAQQLDYEWPTGSVLVMHSDGLSARWSFDDYPGLIVRHPAVIAGVLHRDFIRGRDDATVIVVGDTRAA